MATKTKQWEDGSSATIQYDGQGDGNIIITSDPNNHYEARSMQITVETTNGSPKQTKTITINQAAKKRINLSTAVVTASNQIYNGSAKTPTPTVTLNGSTVPSTGYDVSYSNNTNAGTATITVTGKGEYTGTAYGTFTIAKASRTLSFADAYMVLNTSSSGSKTATVNKGSGDGAITYSISSTTYATINSSTGKVTSKTSDGSATVTATIAEGTNYLSASASYTLYVFATTHNYSYNGSYRSVTLPPGTYQFQCWGAQGGSNKTSTTYGITAKAGGKGGYSVGQLTISQATGVRVYVGGQGTSDTGGYNGGGSATGGESYKNADNEEGYSCRAGGGGASDIRLSDGSLYSRMIVAGGGSGGAMCRKRTVTTQSSWQTDYTCNMGDWDRRAGSLYGISDVWGNLTNTAKIFRVTYSPSSKISGVEVDIRGNNGVKYIETNGEEFDISSLGNIQYFRVWVNPVNVSDLDSISAKIEIYTTEEVYTDTYEYQVGYVGGGTTGGGYSNNQKGKQNAAGSLGGDFGAGANQLAQSYRYVSGAGGGGWYGGGRNQSNTDINAVKMSGGGSGFVNTAASAGNRPSGYTGLELDSGETYAGNTSFPAPGGGNETGHSGDGYIRITRIS